MCGVKLKAWSPSQHQWGVSERDREWWVSCRNNRYSQREWRICVSSEFIAVVSFEKWTLYSSQFYLLLFGSLWVCLCWCWRVAWMHVDCNAMYYVTCAIELISNQLLPLLFIHSSSPAPGIAWVNKSLKSWAQDERRTRAGELKIPKHFKMSARTTAPLLNSELFIVETESDRSR